MANRRRGGYDVVLTDHVFDKVRSIDMSLAEFEVLLDGGEVIEETPVEEGVKELVLISTGRSTSSWSWMTSAARSVS